jgi:hypothetical protein
MRLRVAADEVWLDADRCWRVGLIVAELVRNAARHGLSGGAGAIWVVVEDDAGYVRCSVCDNGGGSPGVRAGRGRRLVQALAAGTGRIGRLELRAERLLRRSGVRPGAGARSPDWGARGRFRRLGIGVERAIPPAPGRFNEGRDCEAGRHRSSAPTAVRRRRGHPCGRPVGAARDGARPGGGDRAGVIWGIASSLTEAASGFGMTSTAAFSVSNHRLP